MESGYVGHESSCNVPLWRLSHSNTCSNADLAARTVMTAHDKVWLLLMTEGETGQATNTPELNFFVKFYEN